MKIAKYKLKRIGVILIVAFLMFSNNYLMNVSAKSKVYIDNKDLFNHFVKNKQVDTDFYTMTLKSRKDKKGNPMEFNITINGKKSDYTAYAGETINIPTEYTKNDYENNVMTIKMESANYELYKAKYEYAGKKLKTITLEIEIVSYDVDSNYITENAEINIPSPNLSSQTIDCSKVNNESKTFEKEFCKAKNNAIEKFNLTGRTIKEAKNNISTSTIKCNSNAKLITADYKSNPNEYDKQYYQNTSYYYASNTSTKNVGQYKYEYSPGTITKGEKLSCKITCEEAVTVEYGPPVASKAGLCFEYKVKVTSRVSCGMLEEPNKPIIQTQYCTPSPVCLHGKVEYDQGGPSEEYEQCIQECDGGKYSQSCSKKCYDKIYSYNDTTKLTSSYNDVEATKLAFNLKDCTTTVKKKIGEDSILAQGCYYKDKYGTIKWESRNVTTKDYSTFSVRDFGKNDSFFGGRWYYQFPGNHKAYKESPKYDVSSNDGFYRRDLGTGHCTDQCSWEGCDGAETYLNPGYITKDAKENIEIYQKAINKCKAAASCSSRTATFKISVNYKTKDTSTKTGTEQTIIYPYDTKKDSISSLGEESERINTKSGKYSTILKYAGCYSNSNQEKWYMTEWSFPGTWINNKTGAISYEKKESDTGWYKETKKFCIPLNAKNVNTNWWNWYVAKTSNYSIDKTTQSYEEYYNECLKNTNYLKRKDEIITESYSGGIDKYNITATTDNFGYFGWNFNIKCFYALNTPGYDQNLSDSDDHSEEKINCETEEPNYTTRTVDLNDLFPATDGTATTDKSKTGRAAGYNWSSAATITSTKDKNHSINPADLISKIQTLGDNVYSNDKCLDYQFTLSPSQLMEIRKMGNDYTDWQGTIGNTGGSIYLSPLIDTYGSRKTSAGKNNTGCH